MANWTFTSESVTEGHPDKMADQISDSVLDAILAEDPTARVACETLLTTGLVVVAGEITTTAYVDIPKLVRKTVNAIGYDHADKGFDGNTCGVMTSIDEQSPDIAMGVDKAFEARTEHDIDADLDGQGAGDQGMRRPTSCRCRSGWPTGSPSASAPSARTARWRTFGPTARHRSRSTTRTAARFASTPS